MRCCYVTGQLSAVWGIVVLLVNYLQYEMLCCWSIICSMRCCCVTGQLSAVWGIVVLLVNYLQYEMLLCGGC